MKYQKILGLVATAGLFLAGCATDTDTQNAWFNDSNAVRISASVGNATTRSNPTATDDGLKSFNSGDKIGISNSGSSLTYTFNGDNWTPGNSEYLVWDTKNLTFQCWYPADGKNSFEYGYIQEDQSDADKIVKSDYMAADTTLGTIPSDKVLTVKLERKTARLIFKILRFNDQFTASAKISNLSIVSKATTDASETATVNITPLQTGDGAIGSTYTALVAPGSIEANIEVSDGGTISDPLVVKTGGLEAGKSYTYNLIVGKKAVTIADVKVADWQSANISEKQETAEEIPPYVTFTADKWHDFYLIGENGYVHSGLEYSVNFGEWKEYTSGRSVAFGGKFGNLRLRGTNEKGTAESATKYARISISQKGNGKVKCTGDIRTLLNHKNYKNVDTGNARFCYLFNKCDVLTSVPDLPATNLADSCYLHMFEECTSIAEAPKLPAKIMADHCYDYMFRKCTSIKKAPDLPATKLAPRCYYGMFSGCTALTEVPDLLVKDLPEGCYQSMFSTCEALVNGPKVSAETIKQYSCYQMFAYCYNLSSVKLLIPSNQMKVSYGVYSCFSDAGTKASTRTLTVKDKAAYDAMIEYYYYPDRWKIGQCTVLDEHGNPITE